MFLSSCTKVKQIFLLGVALCSVGLSALPMIDNPAAIGDLKDLKKGFNVLLHGDGKKVGGTPDDSDILYFPYKRLRLAERDGKPIFSFAYSQKGGLLSATLTADIDADSLMEQRDRIQNDPENEGRHFRLAPLPVRRGTYRSALVTKTGEWVLGTSEVENAIPTNEVAVNMLVDKKAADLIVMALKGNASIGYNYTYEFPARITPYEATITLHWDSIMKQTRQQFAATIGGGISCGSYSADKFTRSLIENKSIEIVINGGVDHSAMDAVVMDVVKIVVARCFKATHPNQSYSDLKLPPAQDRWINNVVLGKDFSSGLPTGGWNASVSASYQVNEMKSEELVTERIHIISHPYNIFAASAGIQFGNLCSSYPELFHYQGLTASDGTSAILTGCPDRLLPEAGVPITSQTVPSQNKNPPVANPDIPQASTQNDLSGLGL